MSAFDQPSPQVSHVPPQSRSLLQASTVPVYSGTLNLGLSDHGLGGAPEIAVTHPSYSETDHQCHQQSRLGWR